MGSVSVEKKNAQKKEKFSSQSSIGIPGFRGGKRKDKGSKELEELTSSQQDELANTSVQGLRSLVSTFLKLTVMRSLLNEVQDLVRQLGVGKGESLGVGTRGGLRGSGGNSVGRHFEVVVRLGLFLWMFLG